MGSMNIIFMVTGRICLRYFASVWCFLWLLYRLKPYFTTVAGFSETRQGRTVIRQNTVHVAITSSKSITHYLYIQYAFER